MRDFSFLSNHGLTLLCIARNPDIRIRDVAVEVGVTERAANRLVNDLVDGGYVTRERIGRRNRYEIEHEAPMRHPLAEQYWVGELIAVMTGPPNQRSAESTLSEG